MSRHGCISEPAATRTLRITLQQVRRDETGTATVEYAIIVALLAGVIVLSCSLLADSSGTAFHRLSSNFESKAEQRARPTSSVVDALGAADSFRADERFARRPISYSSAFVVVAMMVLLVLVHHSKRKFAESDDDS